MTFDNEIICDGFSLVKIAPTTENATELLTVVNNNRDFLGEYLEWVDSYTSVERAMLNIEKSYTTDKCSYFIMVDNKIAGKISFVDVDDNMGEISYWLARKYNGRGIMTMAIKTLVKIGLDKMKLNRIQLTIDAENIKSCAVATRAGFLYEGTLRKYFLLRGVPRDMKIYSIVK